MPTAILLDISLSMMQLIDPFNTKLFYAVKGLLEFLDHIALNNKFESIALFTYSIYLEMVVPFTRKFELIKNGLTNIEMLSKTYILNSLIGVNQIVSEEWGNSESCNIIVITDGNIGSIHSILKRDFNDGDSNTDLSFREILYQSETGLPFSFPSKLYIIVIANHDDVSLTISLPIYQNLIELNGGHGKVLVPGLDYPSPLTHEHVSASFKDIINTSYKSTSFTLSFGKISSQATVFPIPPDLEITEEEMGSKIDICGFVPYHDISNLPFASKHLVIPAKPSGSDSQPPLNDGKTPSLCVLLHGSLKVENMAALCQLAPDRYGFLYSWAADNKKKSNLYMSLLHPGESSVPWLGPIDHFSLVDAFRFILPLKDASHDPHSMQTDGVDLNKDSSTKQLLETNGIVVKKPDHPRGRCFSYDGASIKSQPNANYNLVQQYSLSINDCQRLMRLARKISPGGTACNSQKVESFYRELNRIRCLALATGHITLLQHVVTLLAKERVTAGDPVALAELTHAQNSILAFDTYPHDVVIKPLMGSS